MINYKYRGVKVELSLKEFAVLRSGFQGKTEEGTSYRQIKLKDVTRDGVLQEDELECFDAARMTEKYILKTGDIIFKAKSVENIALLIETEREDLVATNHFILVSIKEEMKDKVWPKYLMLYLNSERAQGYFKKHAQGTVLPIISIGILEETPIILPSLEEQKRLSELYGLMLQERVTMQKLMMAREKQVGLQLNAVLDKENGNEK